ncbi:MAG: SDR family NAD(P)-dependent oxidoreductase [Planctomycetota bacterium]|nr:MAG: SDR family NAD(P)-dependent oxidoreductase [Planctomycetota bacterium]
MSEFDGRAVVVTGGTGALGSAVVGRLLGAGAECWVPVLHERELERFPHTDHERVRLVRGVDLRDESAVEAFFAEPASLWASVHIAGGFSMAPIEDTTLDDWRGLIDMNATTSFLSCRSAVRRMKASGAGGRIVNVAAKPALVPTGSMAAYAASKAAVASLTVSLAEELAGDGVWVNAVVPSIMDTPANRRAMPDADHDRWPSVDDVAATIAFLASPVNRATRGGLIPVYGRS